MMTLSASLSHVETLDLRGCKKVSIQEYVYSWIQIKVVSLHLEMTIIRCCTLPENANF